MDNENTGIVKDSAVEEITKEFEDGFDGFEPIPDSELKKVMGGQDNIVTNDDFLKL